MTLIAKKFTELKRDHRTALITYITAGDPDPNATVPLMHELVKAGADMLELGVPFSEPMAEGPVIEAAHHRALKHKVSLSSVLTMVAEFRKSDRATPIILMGYLNPFEKMGYQKFAAQAQTAGVDGVIVVDLPPEEASEWLTELRKNQIAAIFLATPTTTTARVKLICEMASGYLYYVSLKGVTGSSTLDLASVEKKLVEIRQQTQLPIAVGFGIRDAHSAAAISKFADAVIVGSAVVSRMATFAGDLPLMNREVAAFVKELRMAIDVV